MEDKLNAIVRQYWGFPSLRPEQGLVVKELVQNRVALVILATGGGKSLCYQVTGLTLDGLCIVISPLLALMQDQVQRLIKQNITAVAFNSLLLAEQKEVVLQKLRKGEYKFLYLAPESLRNKELLQVLQQVKVSQITIDEAHCVASWGNDFRPAYLEIAKCLGWLWQDPGTKINVFTATASPRLRIEIIDLLLLPPNTKLLIFPVQRSNLSLNVKLGYNWNNVLEQVKSAVANNSCTLIYSATRKRVEEVAEHLNMLGLKAAFFHGGLSKELKTQVLHNFMDNKTLLLVCTNAFGMGIDKPDIRLVIHDIMPASLADYFQEVGRAGRDGKPASAILNFSWWGLRTRVEMNKMSYENKQSALPKRNILANHWQRKELRYKNYLREADLAALLSYCTKTRGCRMVQVLKYFGQKIEPCLQCDLCLGSAAISSVYNARIS